MSGATEPAAGRAHEGRRADAEAILASLRARRSVRAYTGEPVSVADERAILEAACQAPTAGNEQMYTIVVVRDEGERRALERTCDGQPFVSAAPLLLVFCADVRRWWRAFAAAGCAPRDPGVGDFLLATQDATIAAQNAVVAAEALGLGSCYVGDILEHGEEQRRILGCPAYVVPVVMLAIGHPTDQQRARRKPPRFDLGQVVCEDRYRELPVGEVSDAIAAKISSASASAGAETLRHFCARKWDSDFSREMTRSVRATMEGFPFTGA